MNKPLPTIQDVARLANVSTATVSRALSSPEQVSENTRQQVFDAVQSTGYRVNRTARNLRRKQTGAIVVLVPNIGNPFFSQILAGIEATVSRAGLNVLIADTRQSHLRDGQLGEYLRDNRADGLISLDGALPAEFHSPSPTTPIVFCCEWVEGSALPSVRYDNAGGSALAVRHLHDIGHRKIGHVLGPDDNVLTHARLLGTRTAIGELGLSLPPTWLFDGDFSLAAGARAARSWMALDDRPSAVTCASDQMACGFIAELHRHGLSVPTDVSVVGFDDIDIAEQFIPALTTVRQPRTEIGETAAGALIELMRGAQERPAPAIRTMVTAELVVRGSTAPHAA